MTSTDAYCARMAAIAAIRRLFPGRHHNPAARSSIHYCVRVLRML